MKLIKLIAAINYTEIPNGLDYRRKLLTLLTGKEQNVGRLPFGENFELRVKGKKLFLNVGLDKTGFEINQPENEQAAISEGISFFKKVYNFVQWKTIDRIGVRSFWVDEYSIEFSELIGLYKEKFFKDVPLISKAPDVGFALTFKDGNRKINFSTGPMKKKQLVEELLPQAPFEEKDVPEIFAFIDYDYYLLEKNEYKNAFLEKFVNNAVLQAKTKVSETFKILREE